MIYEFDFTQLGQRLKRNAVKIIAFSLLCMLIAYSVSAFALKPVYRTTFTIFVNNRSAGETAQFITNADTSAAQSLTQTYAALIKNKELVQSAVDQSRTEYDVWTVRSGISTSVQQGTQLIDVHLDMGVSKDGYRVSKSLSELAPDFVEGIVDGTSMQVVSQPVEQTVPYWPDHKKHAVMGFVLGLVLSCLFVLCRLLSDKKVSTAKEIADRYNMPVIGRIPETIEQTKTNRKKRFNKILQQKKRKKSTVQNRTSVILDENSPWVLEEAYKTLRTNIAFFADGKERKVIAVTSAMPKDGKTMTATNLALSIAQIGKRVILIDSDMRLPSVNTRLGIRERRDGLSKALSRQKKLQDVIIRHGKGNLDIIPAGEIPPDPTWLLSSATMVELINFLKDQYDYIVIDLPPVNTVPDAYIITSLVDAYLFVVMDNHTEKKEIYDAMNRLNIAKAKIIGIVENGIQHTKEHYYDYYYSESAAQQGSKRKRRNTFKR